MRGTKDKGEGSDTCGVVSECGMMWVWGGEWYDVCVEEPRRGSSMYIPSFSRRYAPRGSWG